MLRPFTPHETWIVLRRTVGVMPLSYRFHSEGDQKSRSALSLGKPDANATAVFGNKLYSAFLERANDRLAGFLSSTNFSLCGL